MGIDRDEARYRMPALDLIEDEEIREETLALTAAAPNYFWQVPASTNGFHHPIWRRECGLWAHTLMVSTAVERLADSYVQRGAIDDHERDYARAAAILHDQRKNGDPENPSSSSVGDHDLQMAEVIRTESALPDAVSDAVATHMGPWYDGPEPSAPLHDLLHTADMMASTQNATLAVPGPVPGELKALGVEEAEF
jgi:putative nucleotidyltransferase with HDIG domain